METINDCQDPQCEHLSCIKSGTKVEQVKRRWRQTMEQVERLERTNNIPYGLQDYLDR